MVSQYWSCFVDESGNLSDDDDEVLLAALLAPVRKDPFFDARLRAAIRKKAPLVPWPFHRWLASKPCIYPLWRERRPGVELAGSVDDACERAIAVWERRQPDLLERLRDVCADGDEPDYNDIRRLRKALKLEDYPAYDRLRRYSEQVCVDVARQPAQLLKAGGAAPRSGLAFIAGEDLSDTAGDDSWGRYFELLVRLLERVRDVLVLRDGEQVVNLEVARRYASHPSLSDEGRPTKLTRNHLAEACSHVQPDPEEGQLAPRVRLAADTVSHYDDEVAAGIVVADGIANFMRRQLLRRPRLNQLRRATSGCFELELHRDEPRLSHVAATGDPADAIELSRAGQFDEACHRLESLPQKWPKEQATQWVQFFESNGEDQS